MIRQKSRGFSLLRNFKNSIEGLIEVAKNETPMKAELALLAIGVLILVFWEIPFGCRAILFVSLLLPIFAELINSAIERVVDLVTLDYHDLAKAAKDAGSAIVLVALIITGAIWASVAYLMFFGG